MLSGLAMAAHNLDNATSSPKDATIEVAHWWVSDGEKASIDVIQKYLEARGLRWREHVVAGSGTARFGDVLRTRVLSGNPPTAAQVIGFDIQAWANKGVLSVLDDVAREQEWADVIPMAIQNLSRRNGHWYAIPINAHSTNWLWVNHDRFSEIGQPAPDTWDDLLRLLESAHTRNIIPLAIGGEPWEHTLLFEAVAAGTAGAEFYRKVFIELDPAAADEETLQRIFHRMSALKPYIAPGFETMHWDDATQLVKDGQALLQVQGTWVNGEFTQRGLIPGRDFDCFRFPDTQGIVLFNADQYMIFSGGPNSEKSRRTIASALMDVDFQRDLNIATGAAPARVDVPREGFNQCGRQAISDMRSANMRRTVLGSVAMGNANPPATKTAMYHIISSHLRDLISDKEAVQLLRNILIHASTQ